MAPLGSVVNGCWYPTPQQGADGGGFQEQEEMNFTAQPYPFFLPPYGYELGLDQWIGPGNRHVGSHINCTNSDRMAMPPVGLASHPMEWKNVSNTNNCGDGITMAPSMIPPVHCTSRGMMGPNQMCINAQHGMMVGSGMGPAPSAAPMNAQSMLMYMQMMQHRAMFPMQKQQVPIRQDAIAEPSCYRQGTFMESDLVHIPAPENQESLSRQAEVGLPEILRHLSLSPSQSELSHSSTALPGSAPISEASFSSIASSDADHLQTVNEEYLVGAKENVSSQQQQDSASASDQREKDVDERIRRIRENNARLDEKRRLVEAERMYEEDFPNTSTFEGKLKQGGAREESKPYYSNKQHVRPPQGRMMNSGRGGRREDGYYGYKGTPEYKTNEGWHSVRCATRQ